MKTLITILLCLVGASAAMGDQFEAPDLKQVHNTYELNGFVFQVMISKDDSLSLLSVGIQRGDTKSFVPLAELGKIGWPRLDQIEVRKELDTIYIEIPYGQELPSVKGHLPKVCYEFSNEVYVGRERIVPIKQVIIKKQIETTLQHFRKLPSNDEQPAGTGGITRQIK